MNNEEIDKIDKMISILQEMKNPKPQGIAIPDCDWWFNTSGEIETSRHPGYNLGIGNKRQTEEACKFASKRMIRTNRLSLLAHILGVEKEFVSGEDNYYLLKPTSEEGEEWGYACHKYTYCPDRVYMTQEGIKSVCTILNNGEWSLELDENTN